MRKHTRTVVFPSRWCILYLGLVMNGASTDPLNVEDTETARRDGQSGLIGFDVEGRKSLRAGDARNALTNRANQQLPTTTLFVLRPKKP